MTIVSVLFADEAACSGCLEILQPFAIRQSATTLAAAWKEARTTEDHSNVVDFDTSLRDFVRGLIADIRYTEAEIAQNVSQ